MSEPLPPRQRALQIVDRVDKYLAAAQGVIGSLRCDLGELVDLLDPDGSGREANAEQGEAQESEDAQTLTEDAP